MNAIRKKPSAAIAAPCAPWKSPWETTLTGVVADGTASAYGAYLCAKGLAAVDFHNDTQERLLHSLKRDVSDAMKPVEATQALDEVGAQLEKSFLSAIGSPNLFHDHRPACQAGHRWPYGHHGQRHESGLHSRSETIAR